MKRGPYLRESKGWTRPKLCVAGAVVGSGEVHVLHRGGAVQKVTVSFSHCALVSFGGRLALGLCCRSHRLMSFQALRCMCPVCCVCAWLYVNKSVECDRERVNKYQLSAR
jgi:hypothetical protein